MSNINVLILVRDEYRDRLPEIAERLQFAGMRVDQWLTEIGVITGSIEAEKVVLLSQIEGVATVEADETYRLSPPESEVQ